MYSIVCTYVGGSLRVETRTFPVRILEPPDASFSPPHCRWSDSFFKLIKLNPIFKKCFLLDFYSATTARILISSQPQCGAVAFLQFFVKKTHFSDIFPPKKVRECPINVLWKCLLSTFQCHAKMELGCVRLKVSVESSFLALPWIYQKKPFFALQICCRPQLFQFLDTLHSFTCINIKYWLLVQMWPSLCQFSANFQQNYRWLSSITWLFLFTIDYFRLLFRSYCTIYGTDILRVLTAVNFYL